MIHIFIFVEVELNPAHLWPRRGAGWEDFCIVMCACVSERDISEWKRTGEAIYVRSLITRRVNQACSLSTADLRQTPGDNQRRGRGRGEPPQRKRRSGFSGAVDFDSREKMDKSGVLKSPEQEVELADILKGSEVNKIKV